MFTFEQLPLELNLLYPINEAWWLKYHHCKLSSRQTLGSSGHFYSWYNFVTRYLEYICSVSSPLRRQWLSLHEDTDNCSLTITQWRLTSDCVAPRSVSRVVMLVRKSTARGCFNKDNICILRFFLTLLTWDLAKVGGKFTTRDMQYRQHVFQVYQLLHIKFSILPRRDKKKKLILNYMNWYCYKLLLNV